MLFRIQGFIAIKQCLLNSIIGVSLSKSHIDNLVVELLYQYFRTISHLQLLFCIHQLFIVSQYSWWDGPWTVYIPPRWLQQGRTLLMDLPIQWLDYDRGTTWQNVSAVDAIVDATVDATVCIVFCKFGPVLKSQVTWSDLLQWWVKSDVDGKSALPVDTTLVYMPGRAHGVLDQRGATYRSSVTCLLDCFS